MAHDRGLLQMVNDVRAIVVGVSRYLVEGWTQEGPARNAGLIATTLLSIGIPTDRLHLFATIEDMLPEHADALVAAGVIAGETDFVTIDDFWRSSLPNFSATGDKLVVFWSGHGVTDDQDHRIFVCSDYEKGRSNRVFDAIAFVRHLTTAPWNQFADQLIIADACGTYAPFGVDPAIGRPEGRRSGTRQLAIWAVPDGAHATEEGGVGMFTGMIADVFDSTGLSPWPDQQRFVTEVGTRTARWSGAPTWIRTDGTHAKFASYAGRTSVVPDLLSVLGSIRLAHVAPSAYERTARLLRLTPDRLDTVPKMIEVLAELADGWNSDVPLGLAVFLLRIANDEVIRSSGEDGIIRRWLEQNVLASIMDEASAALDAERQTCLLLIDVEIGPAGELNKLTAHLRYPDLSPVPGFGERVETAGDWAGVSAAVNRMLTEAAKFGQSETEVHLLLEPPAFELPFQQIEMPDGTALGEEHVCVVHCRRRARTTGGAMLEQWKVWARAVPSPIDLDQLHALPVPGGLISSTGGIYYSVDHIGQTPKRWLHVGRLLKMGAPYFCWPVTGQVDALALAPAPALGDALREMIGNAQPTAGVPSLLRNERLRGCPIAREIAILWDDVAFRPFAFQQMETI